jgi:hypothetical protein
MKISLFEAMCIRNEYTAEQCSAEIRTMCRAIDNGADPEELLHEQGVEPDYAMNLLVYYSDYMDEQEQRLED